MITWVNSLPKGPKLSNVFVERFTAQVLQNMADTTATHGRLAVPELGVFRVVPYSARTYNNEMTGGQTVSRPAGQRIRFRASPAFATSAQTASIYSRPKRVDDGSSSSSSSSSDSDA